MPAERVPVEFIEKAIYLVRGEKVMLDAELAQLYGVETGYLNRQVKRNRERFPDAFMFQLTADELGDLRCQFGIASAWAKRRSLPYAFTEHGVVMLSSVLRSPRAIQVNIQVVKAFLRLRELMLTHRDLARKLRDLETKYDAQFKVVFDAVRQMLEQPVPKKKRRIGYKQ